MVTVIVAVIGSLYWVGAGRDVSAPILLEAVIEVPLNNWTFAEDHKFPHEYVTVKVTD